MISDEKDSTGVVTDSDCPYAVDAGLESLHPMHMQLFSTWDVRKAPVNCVPRLCTLQVTRLEVTRVLEAGLVSFVLAVSMKSPHRFLRSNEILLPTSGTLTIPLKLTFSLQYPHFLKRGGNVLQIRLQRRKRVRNRPLGGYKNLAIGQLEMSQVLQHSFQGEVKMYAEKVPEHMAVVTVSSLTSTAVLERSDHLAEVSSEEYDDDIFSEYHIGSDTESGDNEQTSYESKKKFKPSTAAVLRLLHLNRPSKSGHHHRHPNDLMLEEEEEEGFHGSSVAFVSSPSDSEEEEEEEEQEGVVSVAPARPTLSPFFGSDRCSMVSLPTSAKSAESGVRIDRLGVTPSDAHVSNYDDSIYIDQEDETDLPLIFTVGPQQDNKEWNLSQGRIWCVEAGLPSSQVVCVGLVGEGEVVVEVEGEQEAIHNLYSISNCVSNKWQGPSAFCVALVGSDGLVSNSVQAFSQSKCQPDRLRFAIIPIAPGLMSARLSTLDDKYQAAFPVHGQWIADLQDTTEALVRYVDTASQGLSLPLAQVILQPASGERRDQSLPFMCSVSVGSWDEPCLPTSPPAHVPMAQAVGMTGAESTELIMEYWSPKGKLNHVTVKVRSVMVSYVDNMLNVTAIKDKKVKGIRIRKPKDPEGPGGSIVSLSTCQLVCRPVKGEGTTMVVVVDGVEREGVGVVKLQAKCELRHNRIFSIAVCAGV